MRRTSAIVVGLSVSILIGYMALSGPKPSSAVDRGPDRAAVASVEGRSRGLGVPQAWAAPGAAGPPASVISEHGLCGTEVEPDPPGEANLRVHPSLRALTSRVPTVPEVRQAFEDFALSEDDSADLPGLLESALEERDQLERDLSESDPPDGSGPEAAQAWAERADKLRGLGRREDALKAAETAYRESPESLVAIQRLAMTLDDMNRPDQAKDLLERSLSNATEPEERAWLFEQLGYICSERQNEECAERAEQALTDLKPDDQLDGFLHAVRLGDHGKFDEAKDAFAERADSHSDFPTTGNMALASTAAGQTEEAKEAWSQAMQVAGTPGERVTALSGLGGAYLAEGDTVSAWIAGAAALAVAGERATGSDARRVLALTALSVGDLDEARVQVKKSREANPYDDLVRTMWFAHPAEAASIEALVAETNGDAEAAKTAWLRVARSHHPKLGFAARQALLGLCPASTT